jgi:hypothetical protein
VLRTGSERAHVRDAALPKQMSAEEFRVQSVTLACALHLLPHRPAGDDHLVTVSLAEAEQLLRALCLSVGYELYQVIKETSLLDCPATDLS